MAVLHMIHTSTTQMDKMQFQCESLEREREHYKRKQAQLQTEIQQVQQETTVLFTNNNTHMAITGPSTH